LLFFHAIFIQLVDKSLSKNNSKFLLMVLTLQKMITALEKCKEELGW
jgi:hypothetical protein